MKILIVDDEKMNVDVLHTYLDDEGFDTLSAADGEAGWALLQENSDVCVVLLDKMMPRMNGIEFMSKLRADVKLRNIPVIMQTASADTESVVEGIDAGVYYYLTKPYNQQTLMSVVHAALDDAQYIKEITGQVAKHKQSLGLLTSAQFELRTVYEAQNLAYFIANSFPNPERVVLGLSELFINAIEHGNLGIGFDAKSQMLMEGKLVDEISRRSDLPENTQKAAVVIFTKTPEAVEVWVKDEGVGFDWRSFWDIKPERASSPNGRGILMARMMSFDEMEYQGNGNEVVCRVLLN